MPVKGRFCRCRGLAQIDGDHCLRCGKDAEPLGERSEFYRREQERLKAERIIREALARFAALPVVTE